MKRWLTIILNLVAFDVCWGVAMFGAGRPWWWAGPVLIALSTALQLSLGPTRARFAAVILAGSAVGVSFDLLAAALGLFTFSGAQTQFVIVFFALWVNFGTTLSPTLRFLWNRPVAASLLGALGGPLAYLVGERIGAITLADIRLPSLIWVAAQYATLTPLWMLAARRFVRASAPPTTEPGVTR